MKTILLAGMIASSMAAQTMTEPPPLLQLIRKPRIGASPIRPYAEARAAVNVIAITAVTGMPEVWLMEAHLAFASIEDLDKAVGAVAPAGPLNESSSQTQEDVLPPGRALIGLYRPDWSYRSPQAIRLFPAARYFQVSIYRIRPGADAEFGELVRLRRQAMDRANFDRPDLAYQVISGAPAGTYVFLAPLTSLKTLDDGVAKMPVFAEAFAAAEEGAGKKLAAEAEINREHLLFRVEPRISWVSDDFASADPGFWRGTAKK
jgi:hypothetical protein